MNGITAVWGLRTYAVCHRNKYILGLLGLSGSTTIILLLVRAFISFNHLRLPINTSKL
jgi:hypothetical protein